MDPDGYGGGGEFGSIGGTHPDKLFRCKNIDVRAGLKREGGMDPLSWFMLTSRYTNSDSDPKPLIGPHIEFSDIDK